MNNYQDVIEGLSEALKISDEIQSKQNTIIAQLQHQISLERQRVICQEKIIKVFKAQLEEYAELLAK